MCVKDSWKGLGERIFSWIRNIDLKCQEKTLGLSASKAFQR